MPLDWQVDNKTYREQGSYRFTFAQRRSMVLACDVEIVSVVKDEYLSLKSNPPNGHYGYAVLFHGSTPFKRVDIEFPATRIFYSTNEIATLYSGQWFLSQRLAEGLQTFYDCLSPATKVCVGLAIADPANIVLPGHPETIVKVKVPPGSQFNIVVYWVDIPGIGLTSLEIDPSDGSDGLDEYPEPARNDPNDPWNGNPPVDPQDSNNDPRDYGQPRDEDIPPNATITVTVRHNSYAFGCAQAPYNSEHTIGFFGSTAYSTSFIGSVNGCDGPQTAGGLLLNIPGAASIQVAPLEEQQYAQGEIVGYTVNNP